MQWTDERLEDYIDTPMPKESREAFRAYQEYRVLGNIGRVAHKLGVSVARARVWATRYCWQRRAELYQAAMRRVSSYALGTRLSSSVLRALATLESVMDDAEAPARDRVGAAVHILRLGGVYPDTRVQVRTQPTTTDTDDPLTQQVELIQRMAIAALTMRMQEQEGDEL